MIRELPLRQLSLLSFAALAPLVAVACGQSEQDRAEQATDSIVEDARDAGEQIGRSLDGLTDEARQTVDNAREEVQSSSREVREAAIRNAVATVVPAEFGRHGIDVEGVPDCTATSPDQGQYHVECTASAAGGKAVTLVGDDPGELPSTFVGTVDGNEVFRQECVGLCL